MRFSCQAIGADVRASLLLLLEDETTVILDEPNIVVSPPGIEIDFLFDEPTTASSRAMVRFDGLTLAVSGIDDVSVQGLYP